VNQRHLAVAIAVVVAAIASIVATVVFALDARTGPTRCPEGLVAAGPRCCGSGQRPVAGRCTGKPLRCATGQQKTATGCVLPPARVTIASGRPPLDPADWSGGREGTKKASVVAAFELDQAEVTVARWEGCRTARACDALAIPGDPGEPVRGVTPEQAEAFCRYAGGRLPTGSEWVLAAMGKEARRFPWGMTGLVCRRAAYGLMTGPCAEGAVGPELAGARPDGATPDGIFDLAGNVAEWTRESRGFAARGGSFRAQSASDLKTYAAEISTKPRLDIGFRCAYPLKR
jgi:formylglycine-generating enzyme required for sulfatase activity